MDNDAIKSELIAKYHSFKELMKTEKPLKIDFLKFCNMNDNQLTKVFGKDAYSTLQESAGDTPNKLEMKRMSLKLILEQYGELVRKHNRPVNSSDWTGAGFRPSIGNLREIHKMKWPEVRQTFLKHYSDDVLWKDVVEIIQDGSENKNGIQDKKYIEIVSKIHAWTPDRKRVLEEGYKIELRKYLEKFYNVNEEMGESNTDLLLNNKYPIEVKRDPSLSEYDRLLGQMIRHNKNYGNAIAVVTGVSSKDRFLRFQKLFTEVHEKLQLTAELIYKP